MAEQARASSVLVPDSPAQAPGSNPARRAPDRADQPILELDAAPETLLQWLADMWRHRGVTWVLARKDFHVRFKRATFGVLWAVAVPVLQAAVMVFVFSHFIHTHHSVPYGAYVLSGIVAWTYFTTTLPTAVTSIVDGTSLTDKVWFPRAILPLVPCLSGLVGLGISMVLLLIVAPLVGAQYGLHILLLIPACLLLVSFISALALVTSALQVYFRDVRFFVSALLMVWLYATPIMYPQTAVGRLGPWLDFNPMTGIVNLFHVAVLGPVIPWHRAVAVSVIATAVLVIIGVEVHRRRDRVFVDLL